MNFLYHFPGRHEGQSVDLAEFGLEYAFESGGPKFSGYLRHGVEGSQPGPVVSADFIEFKPDQQEWVLTKDGYYIIWWKDKPPTEKDLRRNKRLPGKEIELREGTGERWLVPMEREFEQVDGAPVPRGCLSRVLVWDEESDGFRIGPVESKYQTLADVASRWIGHVMSVSNTDDTEQEPLTTDDAARMAVSALQYNYRIGFREASILQLLSEEKYMDILHAVIDTEGMLELLKKTTRGDGSSSKNGEAVATKDTPQPLPTG